MAHTLGWILAGALLLSLAGCDSAQQPPESKPLTLPERLEQPHVSDQATVGGIYLALWDDGGGCKLQVGRAEPSIWLKPMAPCYFIKSVGAQQAQVFRHDKSTQIMAVLGTPAKGNRCGQEIQGLVLKGGIVTPSTYIMQGSVHCADQGLHNFQYELFTK